MASSAQEAVGVGVMRMSGSIAVVVVDIPRPEGHVRDPFAFWSLLARRPGLHLTMTTTTTARAARDDRARRGSARHHRENVGVGAESRRGFTIFGRDSARVSLAPAWVKVSFSFSSLDLLPGHRDSGTSLRHHTPDGGRASRSWP